MRVESLLWQSAREHPGMTAVVDARRSLTFTELMQEAGRMAALMRSFGFQAGDRVAVLSQNRWELVALFFAAASIDAVVVPLNGRLSLAELRWILADAEPRMVLAAAPFARRINNLRDEVEFVRDWVAMDECPEGWGPLYRLLAHYDPSTVPFDVSKASPQSVLFQVYTSGTTGRPKGALLTHANVLAALDPIFRHSDMQAGKDKFMQVSPLFHVGGMLSLMLCVAKGITSRLVDEFEPVSAVQCLAQEAITHTHMAPTMVSAMLAVPGIEGMRFPAMRVLAYGGAPMPVPLLEQAYERFRCLFMQGYGLTETVGLLTVLQPQDHIVDGSATSIARLASVGRVLDGMEMRVVDADGQDVPCGEVGEVVTRGLCVSPGYWRLPEATRAANRGGWFWTGDLGYLDDASYLTLVDRSKDMIVHDGENVYCREVELTLLGHRAVADCAVIGVPHDTKGEEVLAFVSLRPGAVFDPRALAAHCQQRMAGYKCPSRFEQLPSIPRNVGGKIDKITLREPYWSGLARRV